MEFHLFDSNIVGLFVLSCALALVKACIKTENYDFSSLEGVVWESQNSGVKYWISICQPLNEVQTNTSCTVSTAVCQVDTNGTAISIGHFPTNPSVTEVKRGVVQLILQGDKCPDGDTQYTTVITFKCGKTLGSPLFLNSYSCGVNFEWYTTAVCKDLPKVNEVKCYVYNDKGQKIDLNPLIKPHGGHEVLNFDLKFYINICRDITTGTSESALNCETNSASCLPFGRSYKNAGHVKEPLYIDSSGRVQIKYVNEVKGDSIPAECTQAPSTQLTFVCPPRGQSGQPVMLASSDCQYEVIWETEYACPEEILVSKNCKLESSVHGIDIDLTPLQDQMYSVNGSTRDKMFTYYLSVCGKLPMQCSDEMAVSACQTVQGNIDSAKSMGTFQHQQLRYSDGELILTYNDGAICHTNFHRMTVINFHCDDTMPKTDMGRPIFTTEEDCTYIFDWNTPLACVKNPLCQVEHDGKLYDLRDLVITDDMQTDYWEVLKENDSNEFIIINVCRELVHRGLSLLCDSDAAACANDNHGHWTSLGQPSQPFYNESTGQIQLHYRNGSPCHHGKVESVISFICKPGVLNGVPVLTHKSVDGCHYEFEWETASVCAQNQVIGNNCQVVDEELGLAFDLRPLINTEQGYYLVHHPETHHDYYINVCSKVTGTPCNTEDRTDSNIAVCQIDTLSNRTFNGGLVSTKLRYGDNFLNLTYTMGDPYNSLPRRQRTTEIAFTCNPKVRKGEPKFVEETNYTYVFVWATSYACADIPIECAVVDEKTSMEYDLTSLVRKPSQSDWVTVEQSDNQNRVFYINICHHLVSGVPGCDTQSSVCEKVVSGGVQVESHRNLGKSKTGPIIDSEGRLTLVYKGGETCQEHADRNYTTKIHLQCDHGATTTSPHLIGIDRLLCEYVFIWSHEAACPLEVYNSAPSDICTLVNPSLGFTYNLKPLMKHDYNVTNNGDTYQLHICGKVSRSCTPIGNKSSAICLGDQTLGEVNTHLESTVPGVITLTYEGKINSSGQEQVIIEFLCDRSAGEGHPQFKEKDGLVYMFTFLTSYACPPAPVECRAVDDHGNLYDLSYLIKTTGNWEVVDTRPNHSDLKYYINVCHSVNPVAGQINICSGLAGGCQTNGHGQAYNLGYMQGSPVVLEDDTVVLRYTGGDRCHRNQSTENFRSTVITFDCSGVEHDPVFVKETEDCQYHFQWLTPLACPVSRSVGNKCKVITPNMMMTFDLSTLAKQDNYSVVAGQYEFLLGVCKNVSGLTEECRDVGSCQVKSSTNQMINAGKANGNLIYEDGELKLVYGGGKDSCHGLYERKTIITFTCDTNTGNGKPVYLNESSTCQYLFEWPTALACATNQAEYRECSIQDDMGKQYDLSGLRATNRNYVYVDQGKKVKYLINVCAGIVHGRGAACSPNSAVCLVHLNTTINKYESLGQITTSELKVESDMIVLKYTGGQQCNNGGHATTTIQLKCDPTEVASEPYLLDDADGCNYAFQWMTSHACPINTKVTPSDGNCTTINPLTGARFSLNSLMNRAWTIKDTSDHSFDISICGPLHNSQCGSNVASCQYETNNPEKHWNSGQPTSSVTYVDGILRLVYSGGDKCHNGQYERSTVINFVCGRGEGKPVFITEDDNCTYFLSWHTNLACESEPLICSADTVNEHYDLSSLVLAEGYHSAMTAPEIEDDASYYINLCRPLNPIPGSKCPPQAAVCKVDSQGKAMSLGQALQSPEVDPVSKKVTVIMEHGDTCTSDRTQKWKTRIVFECEAGLSTGTPTLEEVNTDTCETMFSWPTYLVCTANTSPDVDNDCTYTDHRLDYIFDFSDLKLKAGKEGYMVASKTTEGTYYINICSSTSATDTSCKGAGVCFVNNNKAVSFGRADKMTFISSEFNIKLIYTGGDDCRGKPRESYIIMECDYGSGDRGSIELSYERNCSVAFLYRTATACPPVNKDCLFSHDGTTYDLTPLSRRTGSWILHSNMENYYWFNLCQGVHDGPVGCPKDAAVCLQASGSADVTVLARVSSQMASVDASGHIILKYGSGDLKCKNKDGIQATTVFKVIFSCGSGIGKPELIHNSVDSCQIEVEWKTIYACKEKSERLFANNGYVIDPRTKQQISLQALSGGRTYEVNSSSFKYILNLDGTPAISSADCRNVVVCQTRLDDQGYHESLGEKDSQTFFIKGEILEAHYTSPTICDREDATKASSIIDFHCTTDKSIIGPVFVYKSEKCQYVFDWFTPALCELAHISQSDTSAVAQSHKVNTTVLAVVLGVCVTVSVFVFLAVLLHKPQRRTRVVAAFRRLFRKPTAFSSYSYSSLSQAAEEDSSLLHNSQGQYGADSQHTGNIQVFNDDSDEDILQL